jgi:hypothetical protein
VIPALVGASMATCPKCEMPVTSAWVESVALHSGTNKWNGISYLCPSCHCVLGAGFDPAALQEDIVSSVLEGHGKE